MATAAVWVSVALLILPAQSESQRRLILPDVRPYIKDKTDRPRFIAENEKLPITGFSPANYGKLDEQFCQVLKKYDIPGGALTIANNGKIIMSRGYGWADVHKRVAVQPDSLFRIASISKSLTAVAIAKLVEANKLQMTDSAFSLLRYPWPNHTRRDPKILDIKIVDLLQCTAGWNRDLSGDPLFTPYIREAAEQFTPTLRPDPDSIIRYWLDRELDSVPGTHFAYSNLCYTTLGRVIQKVSGRPYEEYVKSEVLAPMGISSMQVGRTLELAPHEVIHYPFAGQEQGPSVFPNFKGSVPLNYGGNFSLEAMCADTGWLASAPDLVRFMSTLFGEGEKRSPISADSFAELLKWPDVPEWRNPKTKVFFAKGFQVVPTQPGLPRVIYREGCLPGSVSVVMHRDDGVSWCFLLNSRPRDFRRCQLEIAKLIWATVNEPK